MFLKVPKKDTGTLVKINPNKCTQYGLFRRKNMKIKATSDPRCLCLPLRRSLQHLGFLEPLHGLDLPLFPPAAGTC